MLHWLHTLHGNHAWPSTIIAGLTHGNEPVGKHVIDTLLLHLQSLHGNFAGTVYLLEVNTEWYKKWLRSIDTDMNRSFWWDIQWYEATRAAEIKAFFQNKKIDYVFDFHSTPGDDLPMMICTQNPWSIAVSAHFPIKHLIVGLPELVSGTSLLEFFHGLWAVDIAFETGQHDAPQTVTLGINMGYRILHHLHNIAYKPTNEPEAPESSAESPCIVYATQTMTTTSPTFKFTKQFHSFDSIPKWEIRGYDEHRSYSFDQDMIILIPNHAIQRDLQTMKTTRVAHFGHIGHNHNPKTTK